MAERGLTRLVRPLGLNDRLLRTTDRARDGSWEVIALSAAISAAISTDLRESRRSFTW